MLPATIGVNLIQSPLRSFNTNNSRMQDDDDDAAVDSETTHLTRQERGTSVDRNNSFTYGATNSADAAPHHDNDTDGTATPPPLIPPPLNQEEDPEAADAADTSIVSLTRRLRYMFACITWPIVPLGLLVAVALLYMLYATVLDWQVDCSHPLKSFVLVSLAVVIYAPNHPAARSFLFDYHRDMDGPARPLAVRRFDQLVHTAALLYVYAGITLDQTCRQDLSNYAPVNAATIMNSTAAIVSQDLSLVDATVAPVNSCLATCPNLYPALADYVVTLEVLCWSLLLPLLCLPCVYLWFLQRATTQAQALAELQEQLRDEEEIRRNGNVLAATLMGELLDVQLINVHKNDNDDDDDGIILVVPSNSTDFLSDGTDSKGAMECCICMNDFVIQQEAETIAADIECGTTPPLLVALPELDEEDAIVQTKKCAHLFHKRCIASWVGGRWHRESQSGDDSTRRARRTTCPLCRNDLRPEGA